MIKIIEESEESLVNISKMKTALEVIHSGSNQSWIRSASREALADLLNCRSDAEMGIVAKNALKDIHAATSDRMVKRVAKPFLAYPGSA